VGEGHPDTGTPVVTGTLTVNGTVAIPE